ncbi:MAG: N-acetylmuramoyl-L-alanine amidase [Firmicutes bacterium]|nr:N-acetylmuramoyl-L-alanine amidase [Bacillota bacterium]
MKIRKIIFLLLLVSMVLTVPGPQDLRYMAGAVKVPLTLVVDAGHGGPDGGAEADDGTEEAKLNLAIAKTLQTEAERKGMRVIMTRTTAEGLYGDENLEKKWRKLEDMKCRRNIIEASEADAVISIHMNSFPADPAVRGAQVFYPKSGNAEVLRRSEELAKAVQESLTEGLADGTGRQHMGKGSVYLLENPAVPTVLVECGFLSNAEDLARMKNEKTQKKIAACILEGLLAWDGNIN